MIIRIYIAILLSIFQNIAQAGTCEKPDQLRVSIVPQGGIHQDIQGLNLLVEALETELGIRVSIIRAHSYGAVKERLLSGSVDLARLGPATYVTAKNADPRITAFASFARKSDIFDQESASYYSLLVVRADSTYSDLKALRGKKIALVDPDSTSGAVVPRYMVARKMNAQFESHFGPILYTGSHENSIKALMAESVPAAFVSSSHVSDMVQAGMMKLTDIRILWRSGPIPLDPFVLRGQLCESVKKKIVAVFLRQNGRHLESLLQNLNAIRFVPVKDSDYQIIKAISGGNQ
jgi:phosphonate transport system substrate-binding protein